LWSAQWQHQGQRSGSAVTNQMTGPNCRKIMLELAASYERLAEQADR
jgi:hypothetical protein